MAVSDRVRRCDAAEPQVDTLVVAEAVNGHLYNVTIDGVTVSYLADGATTKSEIADGLATAIGAEATIKGVQARTNGVDAVTITGSPGVAFTISAVNPLLTHTVVSQATADARTDSARVTRLDRMGGELLNPVRTQEGFLLWEGRVAKPGILVYKMADGSVTRELIDADELHRVDSLGTLGRKPIALEHPPEDIGPENVAEYGVGDLGADVTVEPMAQGGFVRVHGATRRIDAIGAIDGGVVELSPGYSCRIDRTPGTHPIYGAYDAIQRDRVYNHVAITERARGGPELRLRADSNVGVQVLPPPVEAKMNPKLVALLQLLKITKRCDDDAAMIDAIIAKTNEMSAIIDTAMPAADAVALKAKIATLETELASAKGLLAAAEASVKSAAEADPGAMVESAMEADPLALADGATMPPAEQKFDSIRKAVERTGKDRYNLEALASRQRLDSAAVSKLGLKSLRKLVVTTGNSAARKDADDSYYRAAVDLMDGDRRADSAAGDPYAELGREFERHDNEGARAEREDAEDLSPSAVSLSHIDKQFKARFATPVVS